MFVEKLVDATLLSHFFTPVAFLFYPQITQITQIFL